MELTQQQKEHFYEYGYVHVPGVIPRIMVDCALRAINRAIGQGMDPEKMPQYRTQSFCPELANDPVLTDLMTRTPSWQLLESLIGSGNLREGRIGAQIALRFPTGGKPGVSPPHIDGMYHPLNGVKEGTVSTFTALAGVFLSDVPEAGMGNFTVWPKTHRLFEQYFQEHGPKTLLDGLPPLDMPEPVQILAKPGDIVIAHYQLAHGISQNMSPHVRYALFFRHSAIGHEQRHWECLTDIWGEWQGMQDVEGVRGD